MQYNNKIYPYISAIKTMEELDNSTFIATLENGEKTLVGIETFIGDTVFCIPEGTILSSEFLNTIDYLYELVDDNYMMQSYSTEDGKYEFKHISLPLGFIAIKSDIKYQDLEKYPKNQPIKGFITNSNEELIIAPDYSKDPINYTFDPEKYQDTEQSIESYSEKQILSTLPATWKNPNITGNNGYTGRTKTYDIKSSWFHIIKAIGKSQELAEKIHNTPKSERVNTVLKEGGKTLYNEIENGWRHYIAQFIKANKIKMSKIISIYYDAITLKADTKIQQTKFDDIEFIQEEVDQSTEDLDPNTFSTEVKKEFPQVFLSPEQIEKLLEIRDYSEFKEKNINARDWIISIFSNRKENKPDGIGFEVLPPLIPIEGYFKLPANTLPNQPDEILTTAGIYVFNMFCIASAFKHKIPYINHEMNAKALEGLNNELSSLLLDNKIQVKGEIEVFQNNVTYISYLTELFMPGVSIELLEELPEVKKMKKELVTKYKKEIDSGDAAFYADNVEKPLLAEAKKILSTDESWDIYSIGKKPTFDNNYKSNVVSIGPIRNPITESYDIISNSYDNGVEIEKYSAYCNQLISGTYDRSVKTQYGGAKTKQIFAAMGNIISDDAGSDCGTHKTLKMVLKKDEAKNYLYCFIIDPKNNGGKRTYIELTAENMNEFIGKEVELRTPLYCCSKKVCNRCLGNLYYRLGIKTVGIAVSRISASIMGLSMKSFHDQSIKTAYIDLKNYIEKV